MKDRIFPPPILSDLGKQGAQNFLTLVREIREGNLTIALGSGASASIGLPIWSELLKRLSLTFFCHWDRRASNDSENYGRLPSNMSITGAYDEKDEIFKFYNPDLDPKVLLFSKDFSTGDPLIVVQQIKNCIRELDWRYLLYHVLYLNHEGKEIDDIKSSLLEKLADLTIKANHITCILNYNYDNSFEIHLRRHGLPCRAFWDPKFPEIQGKLPIYHPHGYLPFPGGPIARTIISESDYHGEYSQPYSWANLIQLREFTGSTCLFIGTSMADPNLRRLLRSATSVGKRWHYAFLPRESHPTKSQTMSYTLFDSDLLKLGVRVIRFPKTRRGKNPYRRLAELVDLLIKTIINPDFIWS